MKVVQNSSKLKTFTHPWLALLASKNRPLAVEFRLQDAVYLYLMPIHHVTAARIWTGDTTAPWAKCMSIENGLINSLDHKPPQSKHTLNLDEAWILPGLIDSHLHLLMGGLSLGRLDLAGARSREEFEKLIDARAAQLAPDRWLESFGWNENNWGGAKPNSTWLRSAGDRPAIAWRCDQHSAVINQQACAILGLNAHTKSPDGGTIVRDSSGAPTGLLLEQAAWKLLVPHIPQPSRAMKKQACADACAYLLSVGVTSVGAMEYLDDIEHILAPACSESALRVRVRATVLDRERPLPFARADAIHGNDFLRVIGFKSFADGTLGSSTAAMIDDYSDHAGSGTLMEHALEGTLADWMREVLAAGYSPSVHAIGDRALGEVLRAAIKSDPQKRVRFEHAQTVHPDTLEQYQGRIISMQPFHKATDAPLAATRLGSHRQNRVFQFREFLRSDARLAFGSDWPIVTADPLEGMRVAITGVALDGNVHGAKQNLTPEEAIAAYTTGAADCLGDSRLMGRLSPGSFADFVALDRNPFACNWMDEAPQVVMTVVGGVVQYDARAQVVLR